MASDYFRITSAGTYTGTSGAEMFEFVPSSSALKNVKIVTGGGQRYNQSYR